MKSTRDFDFSVYDQEIDSAISFRKVTLEEDLNRLHRWHHQSHVIPFWNQNFSIDVYENHLKEILDDQHQTLYIGYLDGEPMSYWEAYWAKGDVIANYYDVEKKDQGIHLLFGPESYLGKGLALPLLRAMMVFRFEHVQTEKVVAEPDIRNKKMIHIFEQCGFKQQKEIDLPDKRGLLMSCHRDTFVRRFKNSDFIQHISNNQPHV
ncbi:Protein N-acetyltransferase, RimJ/RimL family [Gracilibacillus orientalis]|uniref:Lysine N-acyltransferase MbtK n=1 Tax=Gracilibacillus orientalis TaxID=334253 RepID=A0A1I4JUA5_9BACI|nr:GNAT family N-acetyltransferase [Gracilibacillus orientalis]SFL69696.1 Protein N-acetyltransferase, RimJ/RimL family [Gracilibacillus orientalis]